MTINQKSYLITLHQESP